MNNVIWFRKPASVNRHALPENELHNTKGFFEAVPLGNGHMGAMVFGGTDFECVQLNEDTLWSGEPYDTDEPRANLYLDEVRRLVLQGRYDEAGEVIQRMQGPYSQSYLALGDLQIKFDLPGGYENYRRELNMATGVADCRFSANGARHRRESFISAPDGVLVMRFSTDAPDGLSFTARFESVLHSGLCVENGRLMLSGRAPMQVDPSYLSDVLHPVIYKEGHGMRFAAMMHAVQEGGTQSVTEDVLKVMGAKAVTLLIRCATSFNGYDKNPETDGVDEIAICSGALDAAMGQPYEELRARHVEEHSALYGSMSLELDCPEALDALPTDERLERAFEDANDPGLDELYFNYGRYLLIASSRPGSQAANLQGIWNEQTRAPWSGNYTTNINVQMNYWPAEALGLSMLHDPMFELVERAATKGVRTAQTQYGARGWVAHHNMDLWGITSPVGEKVGDPVWACWPMAGPWMAAHLWMHYEYTQDEQFLRERAYPVFRGLVEFMLDFLTPDQDGYLVTIPSTSAEHRFYMDNGKLVSVAASCTMDILLIRELFEHVRKAAEILGIDEPLLPEMNAAEAKLRPLKIGSQGQLLEWEKEFKEHVPHQAHMSHLYGTYPGDLITAERAPELFAAVHKSLELRGPDHRWWPAAWRACLYARFGEGETCHDYLRKVVKYSGDNLFSQMWLGGGNKIFQIDANFGMTAAVAEMLMQSHNDVIRLLPALPNVWPSGRAIGMRTRGGYGLDMEWAEGRLTRAKLSASRDGKVKLAGRYEVNGGENLFSSDGYTMFDVSAGGEYELVPVN